MRPDDGPTDADLVLRVREGDRAAFTLLYRRYAPRLSRRLIAIFGTESDAEDVLQAVFLELHRAIGKFDPARPFAPWLYAITTNVTKMSLRARQRRWWQWHAPPESLEAAPDPSPATAEHLAMADELRRELYRVLARLAPGMRIAFALHEIEGLGISEIAAQVGTSPQAVSAQVDRARRIIAKRLRHVIPARPTEGRP